MRFEVYEKESGEKIKHTDFILTEDGTLLDRDDMCKYWKKCEYIIKIYINDKCFEIEY